jgi:hypothetical protein
MAKQTETKHKRQPKKKTRGTKQSADTPRNAKSLAKPGNRDLRSVITELNVASLPDDDIANIMLHCAAVLRLRKRIDRPAMPTLQSSADLCYTWPGDTQIVTVWHGREIVEETTKDDADARGIPPCG